MFDSRAPLSHHRVFEPRRNGSRIWQINAAEGDSVIGGCGEKADRHVGSAEKADSFDFARLRESALVAVPINCLRKCHPSAFPWAFAEENPNPLAPLAARNMASSGGTGWEPNNFI
jgi:hypothetical protein